VLGEVGGAWPSPHRIGPRRSGLVLSGAAEWRHSRGSDVSVRYVMNTPTPSAGVEVRVGVLKSELPVGDRWTDANRPSLDPRVERSRVKCLAAARELLAEGGAAALSYTELAHRAGVTRPTVFRCWPTAAALQRDLLLPDAHPRSGIRVGKPRESLIGFLKAVRRELSDAGLTRLAGEVLARSADDDPVAQTPRSRAAVERGRRC
jgi:hypothetical protein